MRRKSSHEFLQRWGEEKTFCVYFPSGTSFFTAQKRMDIIQRGARQGHKFVILTHGRLYHQLDKTGYLRLHRNVTVETLPFLFSANAVRKRYFLMRQQNPEVRMVPGTDGTPFPGVSGVQTFSELEGFIVSVEQERYNR